jgi:hypothetical protein
MFPYSDARECTRLLWFSVVINIRCPPENSHTKRRLEAVGDSQRRGLFDKSSNFDLAADPQLRSKDTVPRSAESDDKSRQHKCQRPHFTSRAFSFLGNLSAAFVLRATEILKGRGFRRAGVKLRCIEAD